MKMLSAVVVIATLMDTMFCIDSVRGQINGPDQIDRLVSSDLIFFS